MHHIENDIADTTEQLQPDNHQAGQVVPDAIITELFAHLKPQDVAQFYQSYQLWSARSRIQTIQAEIEQVQQNMVSNAGLMEQYIPSPVAQSILAQLQAHDVSDIDLLDQMLDRGDDWLDHTMQLLEQCEHLDLIHGNYTEWCTHALEGAYDWIGSMHESDGADEPVETSTTPSDEVFDESTEQLLLQKLLSDEEETVQPVEVVDSDVAVEEEAIAPLSTEDAPVEEDAPQEELQSPETPEEDISTEEEPEVSTESSDGEGAEESATDLAVTNSEPSAIIELPEDTQVDEPGDEVAEDQIIIDVEKAETPEAPIIETSVRDQDTIDEFAQDELPEEEIEQPEALVELADEDATPEEQDPATIEESEEQPIPVEIQTETADIPAEEATYSDEEDIIEPVAVVTADDLEGDSQDSLPPVAADELAIPLPTPELVEQQEDDADNEVAVTPVQAQEETIVADEVNDCADDADVALDNQEPTAIINNDSDDADTASAVNVQEQNATPDLSPTASVETEIPHSLSIGEGDEDTIAIPKIAFLTSRATPLRAIADDVDTQPTISMATVSKTPPLASIQDTPPPVEVNTIPNLPATTITPPPDIYGETGEQPALPRTPAPIWQESVNPLLPQVSSPLLPEPQQGFFRRLWLKFLAWLRGE